MGKPYLLNSRRLRSYGDARHRVLPTLTLIMLGMIALPAMAVEVTSLYTAQVPFDAQDPEARQLAYSAALAGVLERVSGSGVSTDPALIDSLFPNPATYVLQFRPGADNTLWVSFDGRAIESELRRAGQPVWGSDRPLTLIWLAVDWGQGRREILAADDDTAGEELARSIDRNSLLRERVLDAASRRGLPVVFPLLDAEDRSRVSSSDIWGGFDAALIDASKRYEVNSILVGRIRSSSSQQNRWSYYFGGQERSWTGTPEVVIGQVADLLAAELAIGGDASIETVRLRVAGIDSVQDYGAVQRMLSNLSLIDNFAITEVGDDTILYQVDAHGGAERLRRALRFNGLIEQSDFGSDAVFDGSPTGALEFFYGE